MIVLTCFSINYWTSIQGNPEAGNVLPGNTSIMTEKKYTHQYVMESTFFGRLPTPTPEPTATPTPEPTAIPLPTAVPTRVPTPAPKPTATVAPTPQPLAVLTDELLAQMTPEQLERSSLAYKILNNPRILLARNHPSGVRDNAFAYNNMVDTYYGNPAQRSHYQNAPGGSVFLDVRMLQGILALAEKYTFTITEIAGASHSKTSDHYDGVAFDVGMINGYYASYNPLSRAFAADAKNLGASSTIVESTCVHIDFKF